jgi:hypothetical protein
MSGLNDWCNSVIESTPAATDMVVDNRYVFFQVDRIHNTKCIPAIMNAAVPQAVAIMFK